MDFEDKVRKQYEGIHGEQYQNVTNFISEKIYPWVANLRRDKITSFIDEKSTVFEYGVGTGWNIANLKNIDKLGFDVTNSLKSIVESNGIKFISDISFVKNNSIDVVICHHVLEHTAFPPLVLKEIKRILKNDGRLLLFVPLERGRKYNHYDSNEPNQHLYSWNVQTMAKLVELMDYKVEIAKKQRFGYDRFAAVLADKLRIGERGYRIVHRLLHIIRPDFEVFIMARK